MKNVIIVLLTIICVMLGGYIFLNSNDTKETNKEVKEEKKEVVNVVGVYSARVEKDMEGEKVHTTYRLNLYDNGLYKYSNIFMTHGASYGSYVVDGDNIKLYELCTSGSDVNVTLSLNEDYVLKIVDGNIVDDSLHGELNKITLVKDKDAKLDNFDIYAALQQVALEDKDGILTPAYHQYLGNWKTNTKTEVGLEEVYIKWISRTTLSFNYSLFRTVTLDITEAEFNNNVANFKSEDGSIKGTLTLKNDTIELNVTESSNENIKTGIRILTKSVE